VSTPDCVSTTVRLPRLSAAGTPDAQQQDAAVESDDAILIKLDLKHTITVSPDADARAPPAEELVQQKTWPEPKARLEGEPPHSGTG